MTKKSKIINSTTRKAVGFEELLAQDAELSGLRSEYAQKTASEKRQAAQWAYDQSVAADMFGAAMARINADGLPAPKWPPGFAAYAIDPEYAPALLTVGSYEYAIGRRPQAMDLFLRLIQLPPDTEDWIEIIDKAADFLMDAGNPGGVCHLYEEALKVQPNNQQFIIGMGWALGRAGKQTEALPWLERAVANAPNDSKVLSDYGWGLTQLGRFKEAQSILEKAIRLAPAGYRLPANNLARMFQLKSEQERKSKVLDAVGKDGSPAGLGQGSRNER